MINSAYEVILNQQKKEIVIKISLKYLFNLSLVIFDKFVYNSKNTISLKLKNKNLIAVKGDTRNIDQT